MTNLSKALQNLTVEQALVVLEALDQYAENTLDADARVNDVPDQALVQKACIAQILLDRLNGARIKDAV
jgi:hypothetical protein